MLKKFLLLVFSASVLFWGVAHTHDLMATQTHHSCLACQGAWTLAPEALPEMAGAYLEIQDVLPVQAAKPLQAFTRPLQERAPPHA